MALNRRPIQAFICLSIASGVLAACASTDAANRTAASVGPSVALPLASLNYPLNEGVFDSNGVSIHYVETGLASRPLLVLLHGFPEFWYSWREVIPALAERYHVVAPDLRGYGQSGKPAREEDYRAPLLVEDLRHLIAHFQQPSAYVVGQDWGGFALWQMAMIYPEMIKKMIVINSPHPGAYDDLGKASWEQRANQYLKNAYYYLFKAPGSEKILEADDFYLVQYVFGLNGGTPYTDADIAIFKRALRIPNALVSGLNYYRANIPPFAKGASNPARFDRIKVPTHILWGDQDFALDTIMGQFSYGYLDSSEKAFEVIPNCGHYMQTAQPQALIDRIFAFFTES